MNNYIPIKKKRNRRSNPDTIIMAARPSGGGKNKIRIRVTIPRKVLLKYLDIIPSHIFILQNGLNNHYFYIGVADYDDGMSYSLTKISPNIYCFWINTDNMEYLLGADYAVSYNIKGDDYCPHRLTFKIKEVEHAE